MTKDKFEVGALSRRFSPDMRLRWMPTVEGKVIAGGAMPFSGFDTRNEAIEAAQSVATEHRGKPWKKD